MIGISQEIPVKNEFEWDWDPVRTYWDGMGAKSIQQRLQPPVNKLNSTHHTSHKTVLNITTFSLGCSC